MSDFHIHQRRRLLDDFLSVDELQLQFRLRQGGMSPVVRRLSLERGDAVAALLYRRDTRRVVLVRQFRAPAAEKGPAWLIETLAGMVRPGEDTQDALRREALEELGYRLGPLEPIATFYTSPGGSSERIHLYYAEVGAADRVAAGGGLPDEQEDIEVVELALDEVPNLVAAGTLCDAKTLVALFWLINRATPPDTGRP